MKIGILDSGVETPEEIIIAAQMTPVRLLSDSNIELSKSNEHVPPNHCIWARNILEQALRRINEDIKGIVVTHGCDCTNREFDIWLECVHLDFMYFLNAPLKRDKLALRFFIDDIKELVSQLEEKFNVSISSKKIRDAIILTNKIRRILKEMSEYRARGILKTSKFHDYIKKVQQENKTEILPVLEKELENLKKENITPNLLEKPILLTGSVIDDTNFIEYLEDLGFNIVADDLCIGSRYFWNLIEETGDPIEAIAKYHIEKPIYSTKIPSIERFDFLKKLAENYKVKGIINVAQKFCEPILFDHPIMSKKFKELGIPYLFIELEYKQESYRQLSTRFEAFGEIL